MSERYGDDIEFCTLGMFIIDDIYPSPSDPDQTPRLNVIGGAGTYSAVGARLLSPPPLSSRVGWIVDCGNDFPPEIHDTIDAWQTGVLKRQRDGPTTKGWNGYGANEHRAFKYLTPKLRLTDADLPPSLLSSKSFHLICSPLRCIDLISGINSRRRALSPPSPPPLYIWEPVPDLCVPAELENTVKACAHVDVLSPNHAELAALCGVDADTADGQGVDKRVVEECCARLLSGLDHGPDAPDARNLAVVVRSGKEGAYVSSSSSSGKTSKWLPAYHTSASRVVDPTGGGNGFLGGLAVGLVRTGDVEQAVMWGNVTASFCIEQVGVPVVGKEGGGGRGRETWNGVVPEERLDEFRRRCGGVGE